jgi:DNA-binding NarL/FixJ family response regulator
MTLGVLMAEVRVMVVDDHPLLREALRLRLHREPGMSVVAEASCGDDAVKMAPEVLPDVLVVDIDMPGMSCFDAVRQIQQKLPNVKVLFFSAFFNDHYLAQALAVKANGYVTKGEATDRLAENIRVVAAGELAFSDEVYSRVVIDAKGVRLTDDPQAKLSTLTRREIEVLQHLARGLPRKEIANAMGIKAQTVKRHVENMMGKTGIHDRLELARFAIREGLAHP